VQERVDAAGAVTAWAASASNGAKVSLADFMPDWARAHESAERPEQSDDDLIAFMRAFQARGRKTRRRKE
jgi:hypothetical protein